MCYPQHRKRTAYVWLIRCVALCVFQPEDAELDHSTGRYLRRSDAINPLMNLSALRVITLSVKPMKMGGGSTVCRYSRTLVAVGDGQGYFGTAAGFGMSASKALKDGTLKVSVACI